MIHTAPAQMEEIRTSLQKPNRYRNEKIWTFLIASLFDNAPDKSKIIDLLCGESLPTEHVEGIWFEAQLVSPRKGKEGFSEGNTKLDLAFGHVVQRGSTEGGIAYGSHKKGSWVCFVEAKCLSDCSTTVSYDPLRNQLARVIENLLCFQGEGKFPEKLFFTLLTPRIFKENPETRLYGWKMQAYADFEKILEDVEKCRIPPRKYSAYMYPDLRERLEALRIGWVSYEELLEPEFGGGLDIVLNPEHVKGVEDYILRVIDIQRD